jgi:oligosaccharide repeat unit polymerase
MRNVTKIFFILILNCIAYKADVILGLIFSSWILMIIGLKLAFKVYTKKICLPIIVFFISFLIYHSVYPILFYLKIPRHVDLKYVSHETVTKAVFLVFLASLGIVLAIYLSIKKFSIRKFMLDNILKDRSYVETLGVILITLCAYLVFSGFIKAGFSLNDIFRYQGTSLIRAQFAEFVADYYRIFLIVGTSLLTFSLMRGYKSKIKVYFFLILLGSIIYFQILIGNRREVFYIIILLSPYLLQKVSFKITNVKIYLLAILLFIGFQYIALYRAGFQIENYSKKEIVENMLGAFDGNAPFATICYYLQTNVREYKWGATYIINPPYAILGYLFKMPDYMLASPAKYFAQDYYSGLPYIIGWAFSPITESFINFGWAGSFLFGLLFSLFLIRFTLLFQKSVSYPLLVLSGFVITRGDFTGFFAEIILSFLFLFFIVLLRGGIHLYWIKDQ